MVQAAVSSAGGSGRELFNQRIADVAGEIDKIAKKHYPEVGRLKKINGVGTLIALTFVLPQWMILIDSGTAEM